MVERAEPVLRAAARDGDVDAMIELGSALVADVKLAQDLGMPSLYAERIEEGTAWLVRAADLGRVPAMLLLAGLAWLRQHPDERDRWLQRAAESDDHDLETFERLWEFCIILDRRSEADAPWERLRPRLAEMGHPVAIRDLATQLALDGRHDEAHHWYDRLVAMPRYSWIERHREWSALGAALAEQGRMEEAHRWYRWAAADENADGLMSLGGFEERRGDLAAAEACYRRAAAAGADHAAVDLGLLLERLGRLDEAEQWLRATAIFHHELVAFLRRHGRGEEAEEETKRAHARWDARSSRPPVASLDFGVMTATAVITAAVVPFVQALVAKAAEDTYDAVRRLLHLVASRHIRGGGVASDQSSRLLVVEDRALSLRLHIRTDETDQALRALSQVEHAIDTTDRPVGGKITWVPESGTWRILP